MRRSSPRCSIGRERAAHEHDAQRERALVGEVGDVRPRSDAEQHVDVRDPIGRRRTRDHLDIGEELAHERGPLLDIAVDGADARRGRRRPLGAAHQSAIVSSGLSPASVSIQSRTQAPRRIASSAGSRTGYRNGKLMASRRVGQHALAREQERLDELSSVAELQRQHRRGQHRRAVQHATERVREVGVRHRVRRGEVDGTAQPVVVDRGTGARRSRRRARSSSSTACPSPACRPSPSRNGRSMLLQRTAVLREHDAGADDDRAHARVGRGPGLGLPGLAHVGEESVAGRAVLGEDLVAAVAVVADRRRATRGRAACAPGSRPRPRAPRCPSCGSRGCAASARRSSGARRCPRRPGERPRRCLRARARRCGPRPGSQPISSSLVIPPRTNRSTR